jgi:phage portal protein BeeE
MRFIDRLKFILNGKISEQAKANYINNSLAMYAPYQKEIDAKRYVTVEDVYSVIKRLAIASATIPFYAYKVKDKKKQKELHNTKVDVLMRQILKTKSLDELDNNDHLHKLITKPNKDFGGFEFYEALYTFLYLQGECIIYKELNEDGVNKGRIYNLHFLYPQYVSCIVTRTFPYRIVGYDYTIDGIKVLDNINPVSYTHLRAHET